MSEIGTVYLVGAGPGDPGLISVRGLECLRRADVVLYDGLVNPLLLQHTTSETDRTCRTRGPHGRHLDQDEINERLISAARQGKTVVRLKGGDPFIFGRGSEEAAALAEAKIPFEVIPGVTAATAAAEYAGISLTHRNLASAVAFITGHEDPDKTESALDYRILAEFPGTLVFYMGLHRLETISRNLLAAGKPWDTPTCVISRGTLSLQRTVEAPLGELFAQVQQAELQPPSLIIVGDCVRQREQIAWFEKKPLIGRRIGITRPAEQAGPAIWQCLRLGGEPVLMPTISIARPHEWDEVDRVLARLSEFDWIIFTSVNGVAGLLGRLWETGRDVRAIGGAKLAAIGSSTAAALEEFYLRADRVPDQFRAEALAEELRDAVAGKRVLWARASRGRDVLPRELQQAGAIVEQVVVYRNEDTTAFSADTNSLLESGAIDWIGLSSPSIARNLARLLPPAAVERLGTQIKLASISPVTSGAANEAGLPITTEAKTYTWAGIFEAICEVEKAAR